MSTEIHRQQPRSPARARKANNFIRGPPETLETDVFEGLVCRKDE